LSGTRLLHGLSLVAAAIVAQAVWGMARTLCPDRTRASIAVSACVLVLLVPHTYGQVLAIALGAVSGLLLCRDAAVAATADPAPQLGHRVAVACLGLFAVLLLAVPYLQLLGPGPQVFGAFYRAGALVFGGGHVVLPLLQDAVVPPGWISARAFMAGYGAAQAVPGPLFTFAGYLGARLNGPVTGIGGAAIALIAIFLPGLLLVTGLLPYWHALRGQRLAQAGLRGVNAAVVGVLGAAFYTPIWTGSVRTPVDVSLVLAGFVLLTVWRTPPILIVLGAVLGSVLVSS
jgi:chromate transporter